MNEKLKLFLYLLMRDELATGKVAGLLTLVEDVGDKTAVFTAPELAALAERYASRLS